MELKFIWAFVILMKVCNFMKELKKQMKNYYFKLKAWKIKLINMKNKLGI